MTPVEIVTAWLAAIDRHDATALESLMTPDHVFVDSLGNRVKDPGWRAYFAMCPDYWIHTDQMLAADQIVLAAGEVGGTINAHPWRIPAAFKAVIRDDRIAEWQVFADNKPVYEILAKRHPD